MRSPRRVAVCRLRRCPSRRKPTQRTMPRAVIGAGRVGRARGPGGGSPTRGRGLARDAVGGPGDLARLPAGGSHIVSVAREACRKARAGATWLCSGYGRHSAPWRPASPREGHALRRAARVAESRAGACRLRRLVVFGNDGSPPFWGPVTLAAKYNDTGLFLILNLCVYIIDELLITF